MTDWLNGWMDEFNGCMTEWETANNNERMDEGMYERTNEWMSDCNDWTNERIDERTHKRPNERKNEWMNEWMH